MKRYLTYNYVWYFIHGQVVRYIFIFMARDKIVHEIRRLYTMKFIFKDKQILGQSSLIP